MHQVIRNNFKNVFTTLSFAVIYAGGDSEGKKYQEKFKKLSTEVQKKLTDFIIDNLSQPDLLNGRLLSKVKEQRDSNDTSSEDKALLTDILAGASVSASAIIAGVIVNDD